MNRSIVRISIALLFLLGLLSLIPRPALAQDEPPAETVTNTSIPTETATKTLKPTKTPTSTATPLPPNVIRPLMVIDSTDSGGEVAPGKAFDLVVHLKNKGSGCAYNLTVVFQSPDLFPLDTGGVKALAPLNAGAGVNVVQPMIPSDSLNGGVSTVTVNLSYVDEAGIPYTEIFTVTVGIQEVTYSGVAYTPTPTTTATAQPRPQLVISSYEQSIDPLQPGAIFTLILEVRNLGNSEAKAVTMVLGGSGASIDVSSGTPQPGGVSGGSSDLTNFAPFGTSNLFYLGDIPTGAVYKSTTQLIVNVTTNPGAYPLKISFVYTDGHSTRIVDDQIITLLVYSLPQVEVGYYRDPGVFLSGQPNQLPLQVTNLGRSTTVLGSLKVTDENADITNNVSLVGPLEPGGYFTMDAVVMPMQPGPLDLLVTINYTDSFNQPRTITQTLNIEVQDGGMGMGPGVEGQDMIPGKEGYPGAVSGMEGAPGQGKDGMLVEGMPAQPETFWQKALRFLKGLIGLNSAQEQPGMNGMGGQIDPGMSVPSGPEGIPIKRK